MSGSPSMKPVFFATPAALRSWLEKNHAECAELWVGFYKRGSGKPSVTWPEVVDEALCFGWIDGVRKSLGDDSYTIRLTPRRPQSIWSAVNIRRATDLARRGLMSPSGRRAFERRTEKRSGIYSYEQRHKAKFLSSFVKTFRATRAPGRSFDRNRRGTSGRRRSGSSAPRRLTRGSDALPC
jgi:uncharacterized protein YdeI (YjbR/CyaY-like superfamily)